MPRVDRASRLIPAPPDFVYRALVDPDLLLQWLPPSGATGTLDSFDPRPGGAFHMTLRFERPLGGRGKSTQDSDVVVGRFVELEPNIRIVQQFRFDSPDPAFAGTTTMEWTLERSGGGTVLTVTATDVPVGIRPEDHEAGMASSLENLAALAAAGGLAA